MSDPTCEELLQKNRDFKKKVLGSTPVNEGVVRIPGEEETIFRAIGHPIFILDTNYTILTANPAAEALLLHPQAVLHGKKCYQLVHGLAAPPDGCPLKKMLSSGQIETTEMEIEIVGGVFLVSCTPVKGQDGKIEKVIHIATDITEKKRAAEALKEQRVKAQMYLDIAAVIIVAIDAHGEVTLINKKGCSVLGYKEEDIVGKNWFDNFLPERLRNTVTAVSHRLLIGKIEPAEYYENPVLTKNGEERLIAWNNTVLRNEAGNIVGHLSSGTDITERKKNEEEKAQLQAQLQQSQKLEAIGTLAGGIAHDFNNLLSVIQGNASLMLFDLDPSHPHHELLKTIEKQVRSGSELTRQLLGYARKGQYYVKPISLNDLVEDTTRTFIRTRKDIVVNKTLVEGACAIEADRGQIEQLLLNLLVNSAEAMPHGGQLHLETAYVTDTEMHTFGYQPKPGKYVRLTVTDTGIGMEKTTQDRIFEPFFTTKAMGSGTGLGLASAYGIVKGHGGYIDVESEPGDGTTFFIYLPATDKKIDEGGFISGGIMTGSGTILLVDDEPMVLNTGASVLKKIGYTVIEANSGAKALDIFSKDPDEINLVVLDMVMPGLGGGEVFDRMKKIKPTVKVLLSSGYSIDGDAKEILGRGCQGFIQKPFTLKEFSKAIKTVLDMN